MTDPSTDLGAGLAVLASKDLITKLLGPTAEYIGGELRHLAEKANLNLDSIFNRAMRKLGNKIDTPGSVSPRVLKHVWDEGRFVEDELAAEYFGGLMASARSPDGKDDRVLSLRAHLKLRGSNWVK